MTTTTKERAGLTVQSEPTVRYMARCQRRLCKAVYAIDVPESWPHPYFVADFNACRECKQHGVLTFRQVKGTVTNHVCDARCTSAKGHKCECSCGGANHGADYL